MYKKKEKKPSTIKNAAWELGRGRGSVEIAGNVLLAQFTANKNERIRTKRNKPIRQAMSGCEHKRDGGIHPRRSRCRPRFIYLLLV